GHALGGFDRYRKVGALLAIGVTDHQWQAQLRAAFARQGEANEPAPEASHEINVRRAHSLRGHHQVALVLAILVVHDHDHAPGTQFCKDLFGAVQFHEASAVT